MTSAGEGTGDTARARFLRPVGAAGVFGIAVHGLRFVAGATALHPWLQSCAPLGRNGRGRRRTRRRFSGRLMRRTSGLTGWCTSCTG